MYFSTKQQHEESSLDYTKQFKELMDIFNKTVVEPVFHGFTEHTQTIRTKLQVSIRSYLRIRALRR